MNSGGEGCQRLVIRVLLERCLDMSSMGEPWDTQVAIGAQDHVDSRNPSEIQA